MLRRFFFGIVLAVVVAGASVYAAFQLTPRPSVPLIRYAFDKGAADAEASISSDAGRLAFERLVAFLIAHAA